LGTSSNLKSSQSICDLSRGYGKSSKLPVRNQLLSMTNNNKLGCFENEMFILFCIFVVNKQSNGTGTIRRVCSLVDLSSTTPIKDSEPYGLFNGDGKYSR
jgi:hypothetical protein